MLNTLEHTDKTIEMLRTMRREIDLLDESLVKILALRFKITDEIGKLKKAEKLPPVDANREQEQAKRIRDLAQSAGLREDVALAVLRLVIDIVVEDHKMVQ
jgi:chorismate mutase